MGVSRPRVVVNPKALKLARRNACERCGRWGPTQVHHVIARGMGGGRRCDEAWNLIALCPGCHRAYHDGRVPRSELVAIVCRREGITQDEWVSKARILEARI
ncbi:MAG: HNH endonuclease [Limnochordales bacterium]|nr:HNH endonuclease [Limnochordales bacterium]